MKALKVVPKTGNRKLGPIAATYRPTGPSCPQDCALLNNGCYTQRGMTIFTMKASAKCEDELNKIKDKKAKQVRHHVSGDAFINDELDVPYVRSIIQFYKENPDIEGWMYCHRIRDWDEAGIHSWNIPDNLEVLASCDTEQEVEYAKLHGWKYATVKLDAQCEEGEVACPFDKQKHDGKNIKDINVTCQSCRLCFGPEHQHQNIVFAMQAPGSHKPEKTTKLTQLTVLAS